jgi:hypothetical protein
MSRYTVVRLSASHNSRALGYTRRTEQLRACARAVSLEISMVECMWETDGEKYGLRGQIILQLTSVAVECIGP